MSKIEGITADPGILRDFMIKVNTDARFRSNFLKEPTTTLEEFGIHLTVSAKKEVEAVVKLMKADISNISALPIGYEEFFKDLGYKGKNREDPVPYPAGMLG